MIRLRSGKYSVGAARRSKRQDQGFTLMEVLVSISLFTIIAITATYGLLTLVKLTAATQQRVAASNLARQEIEVLRAQNNTNQQLDETRATVTLKNTVYTVTPTFSPSQLPDTATASASASASPTDPCPVGSSRNVSVIVTWNDSGSRTVRYDTTLSC